MEHPQDSSTIPAADAATARKYVLIVEDNPLTMKLFSAIIGAQGHHVLQATEGSRCLDLAHQEHPDLIIMDVQLHGMSGLGVTHTLKADDDTRDIPVIVTTVYGVSGDDEEVRASGCDGFLAKPIAVAEFLELIELLMTRSADAARYVG